MRRTLERHPRSALLAILASLVLGLLPLAWSADLVSARSAAWLALLLAVALVVDNLVNLHAFEGQQRQRHLELENAFIEAHTNLDLLVRWLEARAISVDMERVTAEVLHRQLHRE